jgi:hypothetical protein
MEDVLVHICVYVLYIYIYMYTYIYIYICVADGKTCCASGHNLRWKCLLEKGDVRLWTGKIPERLRQHGKEAL